MNYNLLDEDDNKFVVGNADSSFSIAKYGLDDGFMEKLRMLPRVEKSTPGYFDGGVVAPELISQDQESFSVASPMGGVLTAPKDFSDPATMELFNTAAVEAERSAMQPMAPSGMPQPASPLAPAVADRGMVPTPTTEPVSEMPSYLQLMQEMAKTGQPAPFAMPQELMSGYDKMRKGTMEQAQAHADAAIEQAKLFDKQKAELEALEANRIENNAKLDNEIAGLRNDILSNKIDPNRVWSNMSTGNRVLAGISVLLGGLSSGLAGRPGNPAMDVINNAIDRDIDAQKADLGKKQNLLSFNMQRYGRLDQAYAATKMNLLAITQAQMNKIAADMGSKQALAAAKVATGQMDVQLEMLKSKLASDLTEKQKLTSPQGMSFDDLLKLDKDIREIMVPMPPTAGPQFRGRFIPSSGPKEAEAIKTAYRLYQETLPLLNRVRDQIDKGMTLTGSAQNAIAAGLESQVFLLQKNLEKLGAITEADMDLINPLIPKAGKFFDAKERAKLDLLYKRNDELIDAVYMGMTDYNRAAMRGGQTSAFGGRK